MFFYTLCSATRKYKDITQKKNNFFFMNYWASTFGSTAPYYDWKASRVVSNLPWYFGECWCVNPSFINMPISSQHIRFEKLPFTMLERCMFLAVKHRWLCGIPAILFNQSVATSTKTVSLSNKLIQVTNPTKMKQLLVMRWKSKNLIKFA